MTPAESIVLGPALERPRPDDHLEQVIIDNRGMRQRTEIGYSSIYDVLATPEKSRLGEELDGAGARRLGESFGSPTRAVESRPTEHCRLSLMAR